MVVLLKTFCPSKPFLTHKLEFMRSTPASLLYCVSFVREMKLPPKLFFSFLFFQFGEGRLVCQRDITIDHAVVQIIDFLPCGQIVEHLPHIDNSADHEPDRGDDRNNAADHHGKNKQSPTPPLDWPTVKRIPDDCPYIEHTKGNNKTPNKRAIRDAFVAECIIRSDTDDFFESIPKSPFFKMLDFTFISVFSAMQHPFQVEWLSAGQP